MTCYFNTVQYINKRSVLMHENKGFLFWLLLHIYSWASFYLTEFMFCERLEYSKL